MRIGVVVGISPWTVYVHDYGLPIRDRQWLLQYSHCIDRAILPDKKNMCDMWNIRERWQKCETRWARPWPWYQASSLVYHSIDFQMIVKINKQNSKLMEDTDLVFRGYYLCTNNLGYSGIEGPAARGGIFVVIKGGWPWDYEQFSLKEELAKALCNVDHGGLNIFSWGKLESHAKNQMHVGCVKSN